MQYAKLGIDLISDGVASGAKVVAGDKASDLSGDSVKKIFTTLLELLCATKGHPLRPFDSDGTPSFEFKELCKEKAKVKGMPINQNELEKEIGEGGRPGLSYYDNNRDPFANVKEDTSGYDTKGGRGKQTKSEKQSKRAQTGWGVIHEEHEVHDMDDDVDMFPLKW